MKILKVGNENLAFGDEIDLDPLINILAKANIAYLGYSKDYKQVVYVIKPDFNDICLVLKTSRLVMNEEEFKLWENKL